MSHTIFIKAERCKQCGLCMEHCPKKCLTASSGLNESGYRPVTVDAGACIGCGICYTVCPDGVFEITGAPGAVS